MIKTAIFNAGTGYSGTSELEKDVNKFLRAENVQPKDLIDIKFFAGSELYAMIIYKTKTN